MSDPQQINGFLPYEDPDEMLFVYGLHLWIDKQWQPIQTPNTYSVYSDCFEAVLHMSPALTRCTEDASASRARRSAGRPNTFTAFLEKIAAEIEEEARLGDMHFPIAGGW